MQYLLTQEEIDSTKAVTDFYERSLKNILAVVHRDGGQYTEEHGIAKSVRDATEILAIAIDSVK